MTRELGAKTSVKLLRNAFKQRGVHVTHTETLDLLAQLKGYQSWSHLKASSAVDKQSKPASVPDSLKASLTDVLREHYGAWGAHPNAPRQDWQYQVANSDTSRSYWEWAANCLRVHDLYEGPDEFDAPEPIRVTLPDGRFSKWHIEVNLSDRWGDLNYHSAQSKPGLAVLATDEKLLSRLRNEMWDDTTFIVRKDGQFGVLFEVEYDCMESFGGETGTAPAYPVVVVQLLEKLRELQQLFTGVQFCIPEPSAVYQSRPATWAFVALGLLEPEQARALGAALLQDT